MKHTVKDRFAMRLGKRMVLGGLFLSVMLSGCGARDGNGAAESFAMAAPQSGTGYAPPGETAGPSSVPSSSPGTAAPVAEAPSSLPALPASATASLPVSAVGSAASGSSSASAAGAATAPAKAPSGAPSPDTVAAGSAAVQPASSPPSQTPKPTVTGEAKSNHSDSIKWSEFFDNDDQTTPSAKFWDMSGQTVSITGYMGEVLSFEKNWFLVIPQPGAECPFDNGDETYWNKIMMAFTDKGEKLRYTSGPLRITGRLDVGIKVDESGYKTMFRIYDAKLEKLKE